MKLAVQSLSTRLTVWFLLLTAIPLILILVFLQQNVNNLFDEIIREHLLHDAYTMALYFTGNDIDGFHNDLDELSNEKNLEVFVIDQAGIYLNHTRTEKIGHTADDDFSLDTLSTFLSESSGTWKNQERIYAYAAIPDSDQSVVVSENINSILTPLKQSQQLAIIHILVLLVLVFIIGIFVFNRIIGRPLSQLTQAARQIGAGNFNANIEIRSGGGELMMLSSTFNQMSAQIRELFAGLEQEVKTLEKAQKALRESEERHRNIFDGVRDAVLVEDLEGKILDANPAACRMYGYSKEDILTKNAFTLFMPEYQEAMKTLITSNNVHIRTFEAINERANGENFIVELSPRKEYISGKEVILIVARDITKRKQSENALFESERRLSTLMDNLMGMAYRCKNDENWTMEFVSEGCMELTGYHPSDLLNNQKLAFADIIHTEDRDMVWDEVQNGLREYRPFMMVYRINCANGEEKWVMEKGQGIADLNNEINAIEGFITDITERKLFEEALRESEERYRLLFEKAGEGILLLQNDGSDHIFIVSANQVAASMHGYNINDLLSISLIDLIAVNTKNYAKEIIQTIRTGEWISGNSTHIKSDQSHFPVEYTIGKVRLGRQDYLLIFYRDITEKELLQKQMMRSEKLANLGSLAAGIAHELNSPLQIITGTSESLLKSIQKNEELDLQRIKTNMEMINRNGWRCADIVHSLLTYARPTVGQMQNENLNTIIRETLLLIQHQLSSWSNIKISTDLADDLPAIRCDRNKISQILINLLTNARDAMPEGGEIIIQTRHDALKKQIIWHISDSGSGIPANIKDRIFDPFFTTKKIGKGTGLGLSIVSSIIRVHGGDVTIDSNRNKGTTFNIYLPEGIFFKEETYDTSNFLGRYDDQEEDFFEK